MFFLFFQLLLCVLRLDLMEFDEIRHVEENKFFVLLKLNLQNQDFGLFYIAKISKI